MGVKVAKFGGTSVADANQLKKVKSIIEADKERKYVVPSAPGKRFKDDSKITDMLYLCKTHVEKKVPFDEVFKVISDRYLEIVKELNIDIDLKPYLSEIKSNINNGASADYIASRGEYLNGLILSKYLGYDFIDSKEVIIFNEKGQFESEKTNEALKERLKKHERAVIPGFYGALPDGKIKTFSRGGSDITGSIVSRAVDADVYENWTDVSGFLMADPRIVDNPKPIKTITYKELRELSYMGASVLHEDAVFPVRQANIPINIKNTNDPENPGTIITSNFNKNDMQSIITGIAGKKDFTVIAIYKNRMNSEVGFVRKILSILEENSISFEHVPSGIDTVSIVISDANIEGKVDKIVGEIKERLEPDNIDVHSNMALIATVGQGMVYKRGVAATLFKALYETGVNIRMIDQGSSEINIIVGVETDNFEEAIRGIYNAFVNGN